MRTPRSNATCHLDRNRHIIPAKPRHKRPALDHRVARARAAPGACMKKTRSMSLLDEALQAWADTREGVIAEVKNLPEPALDFKPTDASRTARALVQHILESGLMMAGELTRAEGDFQRQSYPEFLAEYARDVTRHRTKTALVKALENTH